MDPSPNPLSKRRMHCPPEVGPDVDMDVDVDRVLEGLLRSGPEQVNKALERILARKASHQEKGFLLRRSFAFASHLQHAASRFACKQNTSHNSSSWPLPKDLTVKVFSLLNTYSLCQASASCTMFNNIAADPACYEVLDLTTNRTKINNKTVERLIQRAGHHLRSLKLGSSPHLSRNKAVTPLSMVPTEPSVGFSSRSPCMRCSPPIRGQQAEASLTKLCLKPLAANNGLAGLTLRTLHLFNIEQMDNSHLCESIAACPSLEDVQIVGLNVHAKSVIRSLAFHCHNLKSLSYHASNSLKRCSSWRSFGADVIRAKSCYQLVQGCPNIANLSIRGFSLSDRKAKILLKGLLHLTEVDFSGSGLLKGSFLREILDAPEGQCLINSLILRDCNCLAESEVEFFLLVLSTGNCPSLSTLDISNKNGLVGKNFCSSHSCFNLSYEAVSQLLISRPGFQLLANFQDQSSSSCSSDSMSMISSFDDGDNSCSLRLSFQSSDSMSEDSSTSSSSDDDGDDGNDDDDGNLGFCLVSNSGEFVNICHDGYDYVGGNPIFGYHDFSSDGEFGDFNAY